MTRSVLKQAFAGTVAGLKRDLRRRRKRHKLYSTWDEAVERASYQNSALTAYRFAKARKFIEERHYDRVDTSGLNYLRLCATWAAATADVVHIVDFGGAFGEEGLGLLTDPTLPATINYTVCESTAVCESARRLEYPVPISFNDDLSSIGCCDIFYSSAAFPYIENVSAVLAAAIALRPRFFILVRNCFARTELIRVQESPLFHNGPQVGELPGFANATVHYPHHTQDLDQTRRQLAAAGYYLLCDVAEESGVYPYGDEVFGRDLIFIDRGATRDQGLDSTVS